MTSRRESTSFGRSDVSVTQITSRFHSKYPWISRFRIPTILRQGITRHRFSAFLRYSGRGLADEFDLLDHREQQHAISVEVRAFSALDK
jgi:hypothetical protein